jgi:hypothetical protein
MRELLPLCDPFAKLAGREDQIQECYKAEKAQRKMVASGKEMLQSCSS